MTLKETLHRALASQTEIEADEERTESKQQGCTALSELTARSHVTVSGILRSVTLRPREGVPALEAELYDGTEGVTLVWLGRRSIPGIEPGRTIKVTGRMAMRDGHKVLYNPYYELQTTS